MSEPLASPQLTIVIPAYNEAANLRRGVLKQVKAAVAALPFDAEVLVVDDGSEDETAVLVERFCRSSPGFRLLRNVHTGKAGAVAAGMLAGRGSYLLFMDMDLATPLRYIPEFVERLRRGSDLVIASRDAPGGSRRDAPHLRRLGSSVFRLIVRAALPFAVADSQCGFKMFRRNVARDLFTSLQVFRSPKSVRGPRVTAFDVELLVLAHRRGYRIEEVPVRWRHRASDRVTLRDAYRMLRDVLVVWANDRRGAYGAGGRVAATPASALEGERGP